MSKALSPKLVEEANGVLKLFRPSHRFEIRGKRLRFVYDTGRRVVDVAALLSSTGEWIANYHMLGFGHTHARAVGQLIRWVRGLHRYPIHVWDYWFGPTIQLGRDGCDRARCVKALAESSYDDPRRCCCVLCGSPTIGDWWSDREQGLVGPACQYGRCLKTKAALESCSPPDRAVSSSHPKEIVR